MSEDDSQEEDCTVFIQELKSENATLKVNAASKLSLIGAVLGHQRIRDELIPYVMEIIEQMDNENEFLIKITQSILQLKQFCKTSQELTILIPPLKILASMDRPPVREQAIVSLKKLATGQTKGFYEQHYMRLVNSLVSKGNHYAPKITASCLIPAIYPNVSAQKQAELRCTFMTLAVQEKSSLVRRSIAENIPEYAKVVDKKIIKEDLLQIWHNFIKDPVDILRIKALECASVVARVFKKEQTYETFLVHIKKVDAGKKSWRVRYSLLECLSSLINYLDKEVIRRDVVECFEELLKDVQAEVRAFALIKCPDVAAKIPPQQSYNTFFQYFEKAAKDTNKDTIPTVKLAVVQAIVPYLKTIQEAKVVEKGIQLITLLLKDDSPVIRIGMLQRLHQLQQGIGQANTIKYVLPLLQGCITDKKWRFRHAYAQNIVNLFRELGYEEHKQFLQKLISIFIKDHNYSVREQTIKSLAQLKEVIGAAKQLQMLNKQLTALVGDANYIYRVSSCTSLQIFANSVEKKDFNQLFSLVLKKIENQKVPNVLIAFFITYSKTKDRLSAPNKMDSQKYGAKVKQNSSDQDVLHRISIMDQ